MLVSPCSILDRTSTLIVLPLPAGMSKESLAGKYNNCEKRIGKLYAMLSETHKLVNKGRLRSRQ